jgi:hypothetical protein
MAPSYLVKKNDIYYFRHYIPIQIQTTLGRKEFINPTTQVAAQHLLYRSASACEKDTPDDFEAESIEQPKWPFQHQMFSSARLLAAAV